MEAARKDREEIARILIRHNTRKEAKISQVSQR